MSRHVRVVPDVQPERPLATEAAWAEVIRLDQRYPLQLLDLLTATYEDPAAAAEALRARRGPAVAVLAVMYSSAHEQLQRRGA